MMIKRSKKKWKSKRPEVNRVKQAECINQSRNSLSSSNQCSGGKERQSRKLKKMRSPNNRLKCPWHRSKSVPPKTVSFCPCVSQRFAQGPRRLKADACRSSSCASCKQRAGAKRPLATKKKLAMERSDPHQHELDPCLPVDNASTAYDNFYGAQCPGSIRCGNDHMCPEFDYHQDECCGPGLLYHPEHSDKIPAPKYHSYLPQESNPGMSYGTTSSVGSAYVNDFGSNPSPWHSVKRSLHTTPGLRNRGADAKYDFLMAKYSEHNYPKSHPALSDYFSFQRLSMDSSQNVGNLTQNKSPSAFLAASTSASSSQPRSRSQTRSEQMTQPGATGQSLFQYDNKYYTGFGVLDNYSRGRSSKAEEYQSVAMRDLMYDTVSQKYMDKPSITGSSQKWYTRADPEMNGVFQRRRSFSTIYPFQETSSTFGSKLGANSLGSKKYDFFDDMGLMGRYHNWGTNSTLQSDVPRVKAFRRSRSSDAALATGFCNYDDKDTPVHRRFSLDNEGEYVKNNNRQHGSWMSSYGKADNWKSSFGKDEFWKGTYGQQDDTISSSKYTDIGGIRRRSCANNSNEKIPNCQQTDEPSLQTNSLYGSAWTPLKKRSSLYSDSKGTDNNAFLSRLDEPESRRLYDKYAFWGNARASIPEYGSRILKDDLKDEDKTSIGGQRKDYTSLTLARDTGLSTGGNNRHFSFSRGNFSSFLTGNDLPFELKDGLGKHHSSSLAFDQPPVVSEYKTSKPESSHHFRNYTSLGGRNVNMNKSQSSDAKNDFQTSTATSLYKSWKFHPCSDYSFNTDSASGGLTKPIGCSGLGSSQAGIQYSTNYFDSSANMLNSLVDQETDRLRKLAGVIERQHDGSQDVNNDIIF